MGAVNADLEQRIADLRKLEAAQKYSISKRMARDEPVPTSDITGLAQLAVRIDALERLHRLREVTRDPSSGRSGVLPERPGKTRRDARGRFLAAD